jgi:hypothetical protein
MFLCPLLRLQLIAMASPVAMMQCHRKHLNRKSERKRV